MATKTNATAAKTRKIFLLLIGQYFTQLVNRIDYRHRYLSFISLALIVLMVLACSSEPATPANTPNIDATVETRLAEEKPLNHRLQHRSNIIHQKNVSVQSGPKAPLTEIWRASYLAELPNISQRFQDTSANCVQYILHRNGQLVPHLVRSRSLPAPILDTERT